MSAQSVNVVEVLQEMWEECEPVSSDCLPDVFEDTGVNALKVIRCLQEERRNRRDKHGLANSLASVSAEITGDFATTHRKANQCDLAQSQLRH